MTKIISIDKIFQSSFLHPFFILFKKPRRIATFSASFEKDKERMKKARLKDFIYTDDLGHSYIKDKEGKCMFLRKDKEASCLIYPARPDICREYPSELNDGDCKPVKLAFDEYLESRGKKD
jgi:Fe-S-cluster containining protein